MTLGLGRHKVVGNASSMEHERDMFFQTRSNIGYHYVNRDEGLTLSGGDGFNWSIGIADGTDLGGDEYRISAHADMDFGGGIAGGVTFTSATDNNGIDGDALIIDLSYSSDAFTVVAEMAQIGEDDGAFTGATDGSALAIPQATFAPDTSPYAVTATFPLGGESSIGVRYQDSDNAVFDTQMEVAYNYGNWGVQYTKNDGLDIDGIIVGLQVGF